LLSHLYMRMQTTAFSGRTNSAFWFKLITRSSLTSGYSVPFRVTTWHTIHMPNTITGFLKLNILTLQIIDHGKAHASTLRKTLFVKCKWQIHCICICPLHNDMAMWYLVKLQWPVICYVTCVHTKGNTQIYNYGWQVAIYGLSDSRKRHLFILQQVVKQKIDSIV